MAKKRDYKRERDQLILRYHGTLPATKAPQPAREPKGAITESDYVGVRSPINAPYYLTGDCLLWKYSLNNDGYGRLAIKDQENQMVHRLAFIQAGGTIPENMQINHLCDRPYCLQPGHLYAGTRKENAKDRAAFRKGLHPFIAGIALSNYHEIAEEGDPYRKWFRNDPDAQEMLASNRWRLRDPWPTPEPVIQAAMDQFQCPGHDFAIPNGMQWGTNKEGNRFCRICDEGELFAGEGEKIGYSWFLKEVCPASQMVDSIYDKAIALPLAGPDYADWRAKIHSRSAHLGGNHKLRYCKCHFCTADRNLFNQMLQPKLANHDRDLITKCQQVRERVRKILRASGQEAVARWTVRVEDQVGLELTSHQRQDLNDHWANCHEAERQLDSTADTIEKITAAVISAGRKGKAAEELIKDPMLQLLTIETRYSKEHKYHWNRITRLTQKTLKALWAVLQETIADVLPVSEDREQTKVRWLLCSLVDYRLTVATLDFLGYQCAGAGLSQQVRPHPHAYCLDKVLKRTEELDYNHLEDMTERMAQNRR